MDIFWNYTIQKKNVSPRTNGCSMLIISMIVDKFATHTCISRQTLCLIITTQFSRVYNRLQEIAFRALSGLEITKRDLFNTQEECGKAAF